MKITRLNDRVEVLQCTDWFGDCNISHFITTRFGGVSKGNFGGMNAGRYTEDEPAHVKKNIELLGEALHFSPDYLIMPRQTHSSKVYKIDKNFLDLTDVEQRKALDGVDALMTNVANLYVSVSTADCVPVLLYAPDKKAIAVIHAGWRGMVRGVIRKTVQAMKVEYGCQAKEMQALIGPSISQEAFEVGDEVVEQFRQSSVWTLEEVESLFCFNQEARKVHIDLWKGTCLQLCGEGLTNKHICLTGICTYRHSDTFFSARRLGIKSGRILSVLALHKRNAG